MTLNALIEYLRDFATTYPDSGHMPVRLVFGQASGGGSEDLQREQIVVNGNTVDIEVE